ncbi:DNA repair protein RecO [Carnobacteriaceae bacterium zg-ZUI240]|nr:DNA repair protein RecO [Carnobacteriaceae bacterium zg-ZUI240]
MDNEFSGIVMFIKEHKDVDAMVKVFTREFGKQMFFVKQLNSGTHYLKPVLVTGTRAHFVGKINLNGLSFLRDYKHNISLWKQMDDIVIQAYLAYFIALSDAVIEDRIVNVKLFDLLWNCLEMVHQNFDIEVIAMMFELKMLDFWNVHLSFDECVITKQKGVPLDFSFKFGGCVAASQWDKDVYRLKLNPNAIYLMHQLQQVPFEKVSQIKISDSLKDDMRRAIDVIYDEYVGIKLKSKKYIEDLKDWF